MKKNAFTLVELSIVLVIMGLLVGGSFKVLQSMQESAKLSDAKTDVEANKNAVIGYAIISGKLPTKAEFDQNLTTIQGNQNQIRYWHSTNLDTNNSCTENTTALKVTVFDRATNSYKTIPNIAFVIASESENKNLQTKVDSANTIKIYKPYTANVDDETTPVNRKEAYDDIVEWVSLEELQSKLHCSDNSLAIITNYALPRDRNGTAYIGATIYADGGYPLVDGGDSDSEADYEWCFERPSSSSWMQVSCNGALTYSTDCSSNTATYQQCTAPYLNSSSNPPAGTHNVKFFVRDKTKTIKKSFTVTIDAI